MIIKNFLDHWGHVRGQLTYEFIDAVPANGWEFTPHAACSPLSKQIRHMVQVHAIYLLGLQQSRLGLEDFTAERKREHYDGPLDKESLLAALRDLDARTEETLQELDPSFSLEFFGNPRTLRRYLDTWAQHESLHHGQWSLYAKLGGFETPLSWKINWGI